MMKNSYFCQKVRLHLDPQIALGSVFYFKIIYEKNFIFKLIWTENLSHNMNFVDMAFG